MAGSLRCCSPVRVLWAATPPLVAKGLIRLKATTTADLGRMPSYVIPADASPLDLLLEARAEDDR